MRRDGDPQTSEEVMKWTDTWLKCWAQSVVICNMKSSWTPLNNIMTGALCYDKYCLTSSLMTKKMGMSALSKFADDKVWD